MDLPDDLSELLVLATSLFLFLARLAQHLDMTNTTMKNNEMTSIAAIRDMSAISAGVGGESEDARALASLCGNSSLILVGSTGLNKVTLVNDSSPVDDGVLNPLSLVVVGRGDGDSRSVIVC